MGAVINCHNSELKVRDGTGRLKLDRNLILERPREYLKFCSVFQELIVASHLSSQNTVVASEAGDDHSFYTSMQGGL